VLERNADYWNQPYPYLDKVVFVVLPEASTRLTALQSGEVDMITAIPSDRLASLKDAGFNVVMPKVMNLVWYISLNVAAPTLSDVRVRQAINYAIDRDDIVNTLLAGSAAKVTAMVPGTSPLSKSDLSSRYPFDLARARELMKEAGFPNGFAVTAQLPTGGSYMLDPVAIMERVQSDLGQIGIRVSLQNYDWVTYLQHWIKGMPQDIGMNVMCWGTDYSEWWANDVMTTKGFANTGHINDPEIDPLFQQYQNELDPAKSQEITYRIFDHVSNEAYFVPIASDRAAIAAAPKVKGLAPIPDWMQDFTRYWIAK
jgi:peptide/nickel transport system substrate-binding protein